MRRVGQPHALVVAAIGTGIASLFVAFVATSNATTPSREERLTAQAPELTVTGQFGGVLRQLTVVDSIGYATLGARFVTFDLSDPRQPVQIGQTGPLPDIAVEIVVEGEHAFVALASHGIVIVDVAEARQPEVVAFIEIEGLPLDLDVDGNVLVVISHPRSFRIYDVGAPERPAILGELTPIGPSRHRHVQVRGKYAFLTHFGVLRALDLIDITDPTGPVVAKRIDLAHNPYDLALRGDILYVLYQKELFAYDVSEPSQLFESGRVEIADTDPRVEERLMSMSVGAGDRILVAGGNGRAAESNGHVWILSSADPRAMIVIGRAVLPEMLVDISSHSDIVLASDESDIVHVIDIADVLDPAHLAQVPFTDRFGSLAVSGSFGYAARNSSELQVLDLETPCSPRSAGILEVEQSSYPLLATESILFLREPQSGDVSGSIVLYDLSTPIRPRLTGRIPASEVWDIAANNELALVVDGARLDVYDLRDPSQPQRIGRRGLRGARDIALEGDIAYIAAGDQGLRIIDVSDPSLPKEIGVLDHPDDDVIGIYSDGVHLYLIDDLRQAITAVDVSDPRRPEANWMQPTTISTSHPHAYLRGHLLMVTATDIEESGEANYWLESTYVASRGQPAPVSRLPLHRHAYFASLAAANGQLYVADELVGLLVFEVGSSPDPQSTQVHYMSRLYLPMLFARQDPSGNLP